MTIFPPQTRCAVCGEDAEGSMETCYPCSSEYAYNEINEILYYEGGEGEQDEK